MEEFGEEKSHLIEKLPGADIRSCSVTPGFRALALFESLVEALLVQYQSW
jgi:hypothetical protein